MSILSVSAALAQPGRAAIEPSKAAASEQVRESDVRQRRAALRETLKSQPDGAVKGENTSNPVRQLNTQERAELRKQLRQQ